MRALALLPLLALALAQGLSLPQALGLLPQSPGFLALKAQYAQAEAAYQAAQAALGLKASAGGSLGYLALEGQSTLSEGLTANLTLLTLPYGPAHEALRQAAWALERAALSREAGEMDLLLSLLQQYFNAYLAAKNLEVAQKALEVAQEAYRVAQAKRREGQLSEQGLRQAEADLARAQAQLAQAQAQEASARAALYAALGQPSGPPPTTSPPPPPSPLGLEEALKALPNRPEIQRAKNALKDAEEALAYAERARWLPQGSLSLSYGQVGASTGSSLGLSLNLGTGQVGASATYVPEASGPKGLRASLALSLPLLAPDLEASLAQAKANLEAQKAALVQALAAAEAEIRGRHAAYLAALAQVEAAQKALLAADQTLGDAQKRLQAGLSTPLEVAQAETARLQAAYNLESARVSAYLAYLSLRRSLGQLRLESYLKEVNP
ncbi:transporter [Thermus composti]|uniref:TolC family protein n=1 Tax=Thermus composti TaxID=532059 RepID=A0ABV6PYR4_9DEIN|nr:TolC family protein [Thermus composti]GGM93188.1 transporter [Thermus composti]